MNENISVGEYSDILWVLLEFGKYNKKHATANNLILPIRKLDE